jgi:hypothetical protein
MADLIQGEKFWGIADFIYTPDTPDMYDWNLLKNTFDIDKLFDGAIVYTHTMYLCSLFEKLLECSSQIILISHNSDDNVDTYPVPMCVSMWYAQNIDPFNKKVSPRLQSIPIGLENNRWYPGLNKKEKMLAKMHEERNYKNLLYINHNIANNPEERLPPYKILGNKSWVTAECLKNGNRFDSYLDNIYNHKFVLCPRGHGIDTHRTWECLYMGVIPIEKRNTNNQFYTDLPICFVDDWEEITENFLLSEYEKIINFGKWNMDKLKFSYWHEKIMKHE